jgi:hypothetical protein
MRGLSRYFIAGSIALACGGRSQLDAPPSCKYQSLASRACAHLELAFPTGPIALPNPPTWLLDRGDHVDAFTGGTTVYRIALTDAGATVAGQFETTACGGVSWDPIVESNGFLGALCNPQYSGDPLLFRIYDASYNLLHETNVGFGMTRAVVAGPSSFLVAWANGGYEANAPVPTSVATIDTSGNFLEGPFAAPEAFEAFTTACGFGAISASGADSYANQSDFDTPGGTFTTFETTPGVLLREGVTWPYDGESVVLLDNGGANWTQQGSASLAVVNRDGVKHVALDDGIGGSMVATPMGLVMFGGSAAQEDLITAHTVGPDGITASTITVYENSTPRLIVDMTWVWSQGILWTFWETYDPDPETIFVTGIRCAD